MSTPAPGGACSTCRASRGSRCPISSSTRPLTCCSGRDVAASGPSELNAHPPFRKRPKQKFTRRPRRRLPRLSGQDARGSSHMAVAMQPADVEVAGRGNWLLLGCIENLDDRLYVSAFRQFCRDARDRRKSALVADEQDRLRQGRIPPPGPSNASRSPVCASRAKSAPACGHLELDVARNRATTPVINVDATDGIDTHEQVVLALGPGEAAVPLIYRPDRLQPAGRADHRAGVIAFACSACELVMTPQRSSR